MPLAGAVIQLRRERACNWLQFRASVSAGLPVPLHELVVAVNGEVCHREGVPGNATVYGEVAALCPVWFEPGWNQVEIALVPPGCGMRPLLSRRVLCAAPEPD